MLEKATQRPWYLEQKAVDSEAARWDLIPSAKSRASCHATYFGTEDQIQMVPYLPLQGKPKIVIPGVPCTGSLKAGNQQSDDGDYDGDGDYPGAPTSSHPVPETSQQSGDWWLAGPSAVPEPADNRLIVSHWGHAGPGWRPQCSPNLAKCSI